MNLAVISVAALALAVVVSCVTSLNVGVLAIALAWLIGVYLGDMSVGEVMSGFPNQLFLTLAGVTLLFTLAQCNGTLVRLTRHAVQTCRGNRGVVPIMFFVLAAAFSSMGPGNIATAALMAPMAMTTAARAGVPLFLMAIMVGNGANAGALSPFAPTGIIVGGLMNRMGMSGMETPTYLYCLLAHAIVAFGGYFLLGGWKLFAQERVDLHDSDDSDDTGPSFQRRHWITLAVIATLLVSVLLFDINIGMGAFLGSVVLVLLRCADDVEGVKRMPWRVIVMVCGVTVLISLLEKAQGIDLLVSLMATISTPESVTAVVAFITGIISVYSSTSGVVLPALLPMVPGLARELGGVDPLAIASAMNIGGHLVDVSPLSTIGALCIASAPAGHDARVLFNKLMAWGLSMCVVGAAVCYLFFG